MAVARVHVRSWQVAYQGLLPEEFLRQQRAEDRAGKYDFTHHDPLRPHTMVAFEGPEIFGFVTTMPCRESLTQCGELCALYVDPAYWGRGFGGTLIAAARTHLSQSGFRHACLWLLKGNMRAAAFYETDGWAPDGQQRNAEVWGIAVEEIRYRRTLDA